MAEINSNAGTHRHKAGVRRSKKLSTRVDLTPMVDLGFLLITFFIFTTSMTQPKAVRLYLPAGETPTSPYAESTVLTVIPVSGDRVFYYHGSLDKSIQYGLYGITSFAAANGIGDIVRRKQKSLGNSAVYSAKDLMLIVKPAAGARYQNIVSLLDEVLINNVKHYSVSDMEENEKAALLKLGIQ